MTSLLWVFFPYYPSLPEIGVEEAGFHDILTPKFGDGFGGQQAPSFGSTSSSTSSSSTTPGSGSTGREDDHIPFGPIPIFSTLLPILLVCNLLGCLFGFFFTRHRPPRRKYGRTDLELWYIVAHNSIVVLGSALAWLTQSTFLALATFSFEISYEVFDSWAVYSRFGKIDHETLMHHVGAPLCILFATQTRIDMRVLCHLSICIDLSGAVLAFFKLMMRAGRHSIRRLYRALFFVYFPLRIVGPFFDTCMVMHGLFIVPGNLRSWTQFYFMAFMSINALNLYFCVVIWKKAFGNIWTENEMKNAED